MIRFLSLLTVVSCLTACGPAPGAELVGRYELGPQTAQGLIGTPGSYGRLALHADGTFRVTFAPGGCIMMGGSGTWASDASGVHLTVDTGQWFGPPDSSVRANALTLAPGLGGVHISAPALAQDWVQTAAGE